MPIYQYRCVECGHQLEALQKLSDPKLVDCPACNKPALKKQVTAAAFKLNGTGWYETDFKNSGKPPAPKAQSEGTANDSSSGNESRSADTASNSPSTSAEGSAS